MYEPVSIFIMDVTNSSSVDNPDELTAYLDKLVDWINQWTKDIVTTKVRHRLGDELFLVSRNYSSAYTIAFYINQIWQYKENRPYFGLTFGDIDRSIASIDVDTWNHPLIKRARLANDTLKHENQRVPFLFKIDPAMEEGSSTSGKNKGFFREVVELINVVSDFQYRVASEQTEQQKLISFLYLILQKQKSIATLLNKAPSTISNQYKKGNGELIKKSFEKIQGSLDFLQDFSSLDMQNSPKKSAELTKNIQEHIKRNLAEIVREEKEVQ